MKHLLSERSLLCKHNKLTVFLETEEREKGRGQPHRVTSKGKHFPTLRDYTWSTETRDQIQINFSFNPSLSVFCRLQDCKFYGNKHECCAVRLTKPAAAAWSQTPRADNKRVGATRLRKHWCLDDTHKSTPPPPPARLSTQKPQTKAR